MSFTFTPRIGSSREPAARDGVCGALLSDIRLPNSKKTTPDEHVTRRNHEPTKTRNDPNTNRRHLPPPPPLNDCWNPVCFKNVQIHGGPYGRDTKNKARLETTCINRLPSASWSNWISQSQADFGCLHRAAAREGPLQLHGAIFGHGIRPAKAVYPGIIRSFLSWTCSKWLEGFQ